MLVAGSWMPTYKKYTKTKKGVLFKMKRKVGILISGALVLSLSATALGFSGSYSRNIRAWFNNVKIEVDGKLIDTTSEPFFYNDRLYVSTQDLSKSFNVQGKYNEKTRVYSIVTNGVLDIANRENPETFIPTLRRQHGEITSFEKYIGDLQKEVKESEVDRGNRRIFSSNELKEYLNNSFSSLSLIAMNIDLKEEKSGVYMLDITYPANQSIRWNSLERQTMEGWVEGIYYSIWQFFDNTADIKGQIRAKDSSIIDVSFYNRGKYPYFKHIFSNNKSNTSINGETLDKVLNSVFGNYHTGSFTYQVFVNNRDVDVLVHSSNQNFNSWTIERKMNYYTSLRSRIRNYYPNANIDMTMFFNNRESHRVSFRENYIHSVSILTDLENSINATDFRCRFSVGTNIFTFKYTINQTDKNTYQVSIKGDFSRDESRWINVENHNSTSLRFFIRNTLSHIRTILGGEVYGELTDKDGAYVINVDIN